MSGVKMFRGKPVVYRLNDGDAPRILEEVCSERGWTPYDENIHGRNQWNLWWRSNRGWPINIKDTKSSPGQYINHIPHGGRITRKDTLARQLRSMCRVYGNIYNFSPSAFVLPHEFLKFINEYNKYKETTDSFWICKPTAQSGGQGIVIFDNINDLMYNTNVVVQKYISQPFLISGYKFDLRIYVFVPSYHPLVIFVHRAGIVRFGTEKYTLNSLQNKFSHLTNTSINKYSPGFDDGKGCVGPGCKWRFHQLRQLFRQLNICDWYLWQRITSIITLTLLCQARDAPQVDNAFELYGFDILVDRNLRPWLLEVNRNPSLNQDSEVDIDVKKSMLHDLMDLLGLEQFHLTKSLTTHSLLSPDTDKSGLLAVGRNCRNSKLQSCMAMPLLPKSDGKRKINGVITLESKSSMPSTFHQNPFDKFDSLFIKNELRDTTRSAIDDSLFPIHTTIRLGRCPPAKVGQFVRTFPLRSKYFSTEVQSSRPTVVEVQTLMRATENVVKTMARECNGPTSDEEYCKALCRVLGEEIEVWVPSTS